MLNEEKKYMIINGMCPICDSIFSKIEDKEFFSDGSVKKQEVSGCLKNHSFTIEHVRTGKELDFIVYQNLY